MAKLTVSDWDKAIGKRIQLRRKELKLTASELSEHIGISQQQLSRYERGDNKINLSHLIAISKFLNTPLNWFVLDCLAPDNNQTSSLQNDLKSRLDYHWQQFDLNQKQVVIHFLDLIHTQKR